LAATRAIVALRKRKKKEQDEGIRKLDEVEKLEQQLKHRD